MFTAHVNNLLVKILHGKSHDKITVSWQEHCSFNFNASQSRSFVIICCSYCSNNFYLLVSDLIILTFYIEIMQGIN